MKSKFAIDHEKVKAFRKKRKFFELSLIGFVTGILVCINTTYALESSNHVLSDYPSDAGFIVIQSPLIAKSTFLFSRFSGVTWQLVSTEAGGLSWQFIARLPNVHDTGQIEGKVNYMLFLSGLASRFSFLINVRSGATWQLCEDSESGLFWNPIYLSE